MNKFIESPEVGFNLGRCWNQYCYFVKTLEFFQYPYEPLVEKNGAILDDYFQNHCTKSDNSGRLTKYYATIVAYNMFAVVYEVDSSD